MLLSGVIFLLVRTDYAVGVHGDGVASDCVVAGGGEEQ